MRKETIIKYVAFDGTRFDSEKECRNYENDPADLSQQFAKIKFFDKWGRSVKMPSYGDEDFNNTFDRMFCSDATYFCILSEDFTTPMEKYINRIFGEDFIPCKKGAYRYDWKEYKWISYEEDYDNFRKRWPIIKTE